MALRTHGTYALLGLALLFSASFVQAESNEDLQTTIRAAIQSDARSDHMSQAEIDGIVSALGEEAERQGVTASDISWRPTEVQPTEEGPCGAVPTFMCALTEAFGFSDSDLVIPIGLGVSAAFLLFVLGMLLLHHHGHHPLAGAIGKPLSNITSAAPQTQSPLPPLPPVESLYR